MLVCQRVHKLWGLFPPLLGLFGWGAGARGPAPSRSGLLFACLGVQNTGIPRSYGNTWARNMEHGPFCGWCTNDFNDDFPRKTCRQKERERESMEIVHEFWIIVWGWISIFIYFPAMIMCPHFVNAKLVEISSLTIGCNGLPTFYFRGHPSSDKVKNDFGLYIYI